jgi:uncharacterized protein YbaP (TraB family)
MDILSPMQLFAANKKEVFGLELVKDQFAALSKVPLEEQAKRLVEIVKNPDAAKQESADLITIYKSHDLAKLRSALQTNKVAGDYWKYEADLLTERNNNWISIIEKAAKAKPTFFAVGAVHLLGDLSTEKGVIKRLRDKGYTVKAVE